MAKGAFLGVKRGKLGDSVGYNVGNSNNGERQGWRIYQPVVKNPQSDAQIDQRLKMTAVTNLYRALKDVIIRGQENKAYGDPSRRAWLSRALGTQVEVPVLAKGSIIAPPIKGLPVMYGSLSPVSLEYYQPDEYYRSNIIVPDGMGTDTVASFSQILVANGYRMGDQFTIVLGYFEAARGIFINYQTSSFFLSSDDLRSIDVVTGGVQVSFESVSPGGPDDSVTFGLKSGYVPNNTCLLVSISRDGDTQHLRSTAEFALASGMEEYLYGLEPEEQRQRKASYRKTQSASADWEQVPTRGGSSTGGYTVLVADGSTIQAVSTSMTQGYVVVVSDVGEEYYVKCADSQSTAYNRWLTAKSGATLGAMWSQTEPAGGAPNDAHVNLYSGTQATAEQKQLFYFLVSQGFDPLGLAGNLPAN